MRNFEYGDLVVVVVGIWMGILSYPA